LRYSTIGKTVRPVAGLIIIIIFILYIEYTHDDIIKYIIYKGGFFRIIINWHRDSRVIVIVAHCGRFCFERVR